MFHFVKSFITAKQEAKKIEKEKDQARKRQEFREKLYLAEQKNLRFINEALDFNDQLKHDPQHKGEVSINFYDQAIKSAMKRNTISHPIVIKYQSYCIVADRVSKDWFAETDPKKRQLLFDELIWIEQQKEDFLKSLSEADRELIKVYA